MDTEVQILETDDYDPLIECWNRAGLHHKPHGRDSKASIVKQMEDDHILFLGIPNELAHGKTGGKKELVASVIATHDGRKGWINRLAVMPEYRRRGLGKQLIEECEKWFTECGLGIFCLQIEEPNPESRDLFESLDYKRFEEVAYYTKRIDPEI